MAKATRAAAAARRASLCSHDSDVKFLCANDQPVLAHKNLLCMASPVWKDLIDSVQDCSVIPAKDDCAETMELLLCILYPVLPREVVDAVSHCFAALQLGPRAAFALV